MERRPNPKGWVPPKAPYNPYDKADQRPAEGYPSEFATPGQPRRWTRIPRAAKHAEEVKATLAHLNYTPKPASELYPGQFKVLRRKQTSQFNAGVRFVGKTMMWGIILSSVFFYRWNDGYDNVFSVPYRFQLRVRKLLFNNLSEQQESDLEGKQRGMIRKTSTSPSLAGAAGGQNQPVQEHPNAFERPQRSHLIEAERRMQSQQEALLRAVQIAKSKVGGSNADGTNQSSNNG